MDQTFNQTTATDPADRPTAGARIVGLLAVLGGAGLLVAMVTVAGGLMRTPPLTWAGIWADPFLGVVMFAGATGGFIALCVALAGLGMAIGPERDPLVASVAAIGAIGGAFGVLGFPIGFFAMPIAALIVVLHLARIGRLPTSIAVLHLTAVVGSVVVSALWAQNASLGGGDLIVLLYPASWIAIGLALYHGRPASGSLASWPTLGR
ncbi:MAG TPA: hypothetical protein VFI77_07335 [Gemmatimonadales bacterium]|nr:hypothetical protein [Gemmatimonadales bacterium]